MARLPDDFSFRDVFQQFLDEYAACRSYWYVPKARAMSDDNVEFARRVLRLIFNEFLGREWNRTTQDDLLRRMREERIVEPRGEGSIANRTALTRIIKQFLATLGLLWIQDEREIIITDAGLELLVEEEDFDPRPLAEAQVAKIQYPNPTLDEAYAGEFRGILPHLFLLQVLQACGYELADEEYELFVNLAQEQADLDRVVRYIEHWRDLAPAEREQLLEIVAGIPVPTGDPGQAQLFEEEEQPAGGATRYRRIHLNSSYQRALYAYPAYLRLRDGRVVCEARDQVDEVIRERLDGLKITIFANAEDWFAYLGDPEQQPSWFTYLTDAVERAETKEQAATVVAAHMEQLEELPEDQQEEIQRRQIEKGMEEFLVGQLVMIEDGLRLVDGGRQYSTPIGRIDLLCQSRGGEYVVIEIKAEEATDSAFGQILRYIGWVHRNLDDGRDNVRGVIVAPKFPDKARYSRVGLLKPHAEQFLQFFPFKVGA